MEYDPVQEVRLAHKDAYAEIYDVVSDAAASPSLALPTGAQNRLWLALDQLRACSAPSEDIEFAQGISVTLHVAAHALRRSRRGNIVLKQNLSHYLTATAGEWLKQLPMQLSA